MGFAEGCSSKNKKFRRHKSDVWLVKTDLCENLVDTNLIIVNGAANVDARY